MKRKSAHKHKIFVSRKPTFGFSVIVLLIFFGAFFVLLEAMQLSSTVHVLGAQTFLAHDDTDDREEPVQTNISLKTVPMTPSPTSSLTLSQSPETDHVENDTLVDCVNGDGKHVTMSFIACKTLHQKLEKKTFSFTPLTKSSSSSGKIVLEKRKHEKITTPAALFKEKSSIEDRKNTEKEKQNKEAGSDVLVEKHEDNTTSLTKDDVKATTNLPVSLDEKTKTVMTTIATEEQEIHVLPDKAVENVLNAHILTNVESESASDSSTIVKKIALTQLNNQPVFAVSGVSEKKVFGFIPVAFSKTVFVSATDGTVLKTDETFINTLLEKLSL